MESGSDMAFPGVSDEWMGYRRQTFQFRDRAAYLVEPADALPGNPWIWRARFFGAFPSVDVALLGRGFHVAHIDVTHFYGAPRLVVPLWDAFYAFLVHEVGLSSRMVLEGFSRGGLPIYNWASLHPDRVACLYGDAPVCDIRSWPGGKGVGLGSVEDWERCLAVYGLTDDSAKTFSGNPIDLLEPIVEAGIPMIHVCGDADESVPLEENTLVLRERLEALGGSMKLIVKKGVGHHPHSLDPPDQIVDYILAHARWSMG